MNARRNTTLLVLALGLVWVLGGCETPQRDENSAPANRPSTPTTGPSSTVDTPTPADNAASNAPTHAAANTAPSNTPANEPTPATKPATTEPATPTSGQTQTPTPAAGLAGVTFLSVDKKEVGMTPAGLAMGNWRLRFTDTEVHWQHSDMVELMAYTLAEDGTITATRKFGPAGKAIVAKYDAQKKQVTWENVVYQAK